MNQKFKESFSNLNIFEKRNQISNELIIISELLQHIEIKEGLSDSKVSVKNYEFIKHNSLNESEMLDFLYEDIYIIEKELLTILALSDAKRN